MIIIDDSVIFLLISVVVCVSINIMMVLFLKTQFGDMIGESKNTIRTLKANVKEIVRDVEDIIDKAGAESSGAMGLIAQLAPLLQFLPQILANVSTETNNNKLPGGE